jgi:hypothetical protein
MTKPLTAIEAAEAAMQEYGRKVAAKPRTLAAWVAESEVHDRKYRIREKTRLEREIAKETLQEKFKRQIRAIKERGKGA